MDRTALLSCSLLSTFDASSPWIFRQNKSQNATVHGLHALLVQECIFVLLQGITARIVINIPVLHPSHRGDNISSVSIFIYVALMCKTITS